MKFTCNDCDALCCRQALQLYTKAEFKRAKKLKANIKYVQMTKNAYLPIIDVVDYKCEFLIDNKCSIYEDRFHVCKGYFCSMLRMNKSDLSTTKDILNEFTNGKCALPTEQPLIFFEKDIKKWKYPIVSLEEHSERIRDGIEHYKSLTI